ncbi:MAG: class I SAM-dependent methyltransferase [bacterium]
MKKTIHQKFDEFSNFLSNIDAADLRSYKNEFFQQIDNIAEDLKRAPNREELENQFYDICSKLEVSPIHRRCREKPLGYSGDYQTIDWIYTKKTAASGKAKLFDIMFHTYEGADAVRNRKQWFIKKCLELAKKKIPLDILDLGCGPCRDVLEMYRASGNGSGNGKNIYFHCVDHEPEAIQYANKLLAHMEYQKNIRLDCSNVFRLKTSKKYDLIWSAGLFDYLDDRIAALLLKKTWRLLKDDGQIIFGNFSPKNPARKGMGLALQWHLIHRTANDLIKLVRNAGIPFSELEVESESLGINLFCIISK